MISRLPAVRTLVAVAASATLLSLAAPASANAALGLALATFNWGPWLAYVVAIIVFEAIVIGRWLGFSIGKSLAYSTGANLLTAVLGSPVSSIASYSFPLISGSVLDPNPFGQTLALFAAFGVASACIEAGVWWHAVRERAHKVGASRRRLLARSAVAHLVGVPLGLGILLIPGRPYRGLEMRVSHQRHAWLQTQVLMAINDYLGEHEALPPDRTYAELLERLQPRLGRFAADPGLWAAAYHPVYHRFDTGEMRRGAAVEWNPAVASEKLLEGPPRTIWLTRSRVDGFCEGLVMQLPGVVVSRTIDPERLGFAQPGTRSQYR
jgi:hypothetical protein